MYICGMRRFYNTLLLLLVTLAAFAQISSGGAPVPFNAGEYAGGGALKSGRFSALGAGGFFQKLDVDTVYHPAEPGSKTFVAGNVCKVDITPDNSGTVFTSNGYKVWRTGITSPGAAAINVVFSEFNIPEGAKLFLYNPSQSVVLGAFTSVNNNSENVLPVQPLSADTIIVEYQEPDAASGYGFRGKLKIGYAGHNFYDVNGYLKQTNPGGGISCCKQAYLADPENPVINASCLIFVTYTDKSQCTYGSGALINNPDGKPYVISANHVFQKKYAATSVFFFMNHMVKDGVKGSAELSIAGSKSVTAAEDLDLAMVELNQMPPKDYRPYFAGWDANENAGYSNPYKCIHHPNGDFAKISYATQQAVISKTNFDTQKFLYKSFWKIAKWSDGATEGGSSGSPLLNSDNKIVGCLTGGSSSCSNPVNDYYWMLSFAWEFHVDSEMRLKNWLDPHNQGIKSMAGADPYASDFPCSRVSNFADGDEIGYQRLSGTATGYQAGHNSLGCTAYAEKYEFDDDTEVYGIYTGSYKGKYKSGSDLYVKVYAGGDTPGEELASAVFRPTDYSYSYSGTLTPSANKNWNSRDTYIRFSEPVKVNKECYIAISFPDYANPDTLALYQTTNRASGNSAYYYKGGAWYAFTAYPSQPQAASLWLQPVVATVESTDVAESSSDVAGGFNIAVYPDGSLMLFALNSIEPDAAYTILDMSGRSITAGTADLADGSAVIPFKAPKGIYIIALQGSVAAETYKFLWR